MLLSGAVIGIVWASLLAGTHVLLTARCPRLNRSRAASLLLLVALAGASTTTLLWSLLPDPNPHGQSHAAVAVVGALTAVLCGFVLYMPLYYALVSSLSGQMLIYLDEAPDGRVARSALSTPETLGQIVGPRLQSMVRSGLIREHEGRYLATRHGQRVAALFRAVKALWRLAPGG